MSVSRLRPFQESGGGGMECRCPKNVFFTATGIFINILLRSLWCNLVFWETGKCDGCMRRDGKMVLFHWDMRSSVLIHTQKKSSLILPKTSADLIHVPTSNSTIHFPNLHLSPFLYGTIAREIGEFLCLRDLGQRIRVRGPSSSSSFFLRALCTYLHMCFFGSDYVQCFPWGQYLRAKRNFFPCLWGESQGCVRQEVTCGCGGDSGLLCPR